MSCLFVSRYERLKNYFQILGLNAGATEDEIRKAFRSLVKQYHPDLNKAPEAPSKFMEIHEAYEFLTDASRRESHENSLKRKRGLSDEQLHQREVIYKRWVQQQQELAKRRAAYYAERDFDSYKKSGWYTAFKAANLLYNLAFLVFCIAVIAIPIYKYAADQELPPERQSSFIHYFIPSLLGLIFAGFGYYFLFVEKSDER